MSHQRGNVKKSKAQKYQNKSAFKNNKHDASKLTKALNGMTIGGVCDRCRETIQWKIKYKKYKPLTQAKKCTKCSQKTVKHAYHIICPKCARDAGVCAKCGTSGDSVNPYAPTPTEQAAADSKMEAELKALSERQRRAFFRWQDQGFRDDGQGMSEKEAKNFEDKEEEDDEASEGDDIGDERPSDSLIGEEKCKKWCEDNHVTDDLGDGLASGLTLEDDLGVELASGLTLNDVDEKKEEGSNNSDDSKEQNKSVVL